MRARCAPRWRPCSPTRPPASAAPPAPAAARAAPPRGARALRLGRHRAAAPRPLCEARGVSEWRETNRAWWGERVPIHVDSEVYDVARFLGRSSALFDFVVEELGDDDVPALPLMYSLLATAPA